MLNLTDKEVNILAAKFYQIRYPTRNFYNLRQDKQRYWNECVREFLEEIDHVQ